MNLRKESEERVVKIVTIIGSVIAIVSAMVGILGWLLHQSKDPFLKYVVIVGIIFCLSFWIIMKYGSGESQKKTSRILFITTAVLSTLAVLWRSLSVFFYTKYPDKYPIPPGYKHEPYYLPYFLLLGACMLIIISLIHYYTIEEGNRKNRLPILVTFLVMSFYLMACRIVWHVVDFFVWTK